MTSRTTLPRLVATATGLVLAWLAFDHVTKSVELQLPM